MLLLEGIIPKVNLSSVLKLLKRKLKVENNVKKNYYIGKEDKKTDIWQNKVVEREIQWKVGKLEIMN